MRISVVTPSFNQGNYLQECIDSVERQRIHDVEHWVIDGGSSDRTVAVLHDNAAKLAGWVSEPDRGQTHALNKGLARCTGDLIGWQNSDDYYLPGAFEGVITAALAEPNVDVFFADIKIVDETSRVIGRSHYYPFRPADLLYQGQLLSNQAVFFRRSVLDRFGYPDETLAFAMDFEFFLRVATGGATMRFIPQLWGAFRIHGNSKTSSIATVGVAEMHEVMRRHGVDHRLPLTRLIRYLMLVRRSIRMLSVGEFGYVFRGLRHTLFGGPPATVHERVD
jgi:glycosyltransferase involved in cell wall biosynthesis